jgi:hypothetical protein
VVAVDKRPSYVRGLQGRACLMNAAYAPVAPDWRVLQAVVFRYRLLSVPREMQTGDHPVPTLHNLHLNETIQTVGINLALFADDTRLYATELKVGYVFRKLQHGLISMAAWCER